MGLWPTRGNENRRCRPREGGDPLLVRNTMDSRFRGNDVSFGGVIMGLWPTRGNENQRRRPRESGGPSFACDGFPLSRE